MTDEERADLAALEALVVDNAELAELERLLGGFNLFEVLGNVRREERHSDFLAFLLDPGEAHGLGGAILRAFLQAAVSAGGREPAALRPIDVALLDLSIARVEREWNRIDLIAVVENERFVLLIENKVDTDEHSDQLRRYLEWVRTRFPGWGILPVFLTRDGHEPSHPSWHPVSYSDVHGILRGGLTAQRAQLPPDIEVALRHYVQMLERHIMDDSPIAVLARKIYQRHQRALDIVFEHRPDALEQMRSALVEGIEAHPGLRLVASSKSYVHFVPVAWDGLSTLREGGDGTWMRAKDLLRFEFKLQTGLSLHLIVGPGSEAPRKFLHDATRANRLFKNRSPRLSARFTQLWRVNFLTKKEEEQLTTESRIEKARRSQAQFHGKVLPELTRFVTSLFTSDVEPRPTSGSPAGEEQVG